ncbi:hypothetical protein EV137_5197 [Kribbella pratensis]|uniref:Uncharacterized protein n=1 Tax=Kribbella pratensis TaxID=2512112 RepID=A0ABY2F958_9ACTN|nr:hypothetical protein [Kribbella pratensis]TDW87125.1 hypothetical protein EV137_5197 [Kribbella pratensis]
MTRLFLVKDGETELWVAALVDEDVWTYVGNTGKFHYNEGARHDYYFLNGLQYVDIGIAEAKRLIQAGVGTVDEDELPDSVHRWREDPKGMDPDVVFASMAADLA